MIAREDILIGEGDSGTLTVSGTGKFSCYGPNNEAKWIKLGDAGAGANTINLDEGGTIEAWHIERVTSSGTCTINFNGGKLVALTTANPDGWNKYIIGNTDSGHSTEPTITISEKGGFIDVGALYNNEITAPVTGLGTITKSGTATLKFSGSYAGGIKVENGAGSVTTPGNQQLSAGQNVFLVSKVSAEMTCAQAGNLAADRPIWFESNGQIELTDCVLDFSAQEEQCLFAATSITVDGASVASNADITSYVRVLNATEAHKVIFKDNGVYAVADRVKNKWIGAETGDWYDETNWSEGVPTATSHVVFDKNVVVKRSDQSVKKCWVKLTLENNARVEFLNDNDGNYPAYEIAAGCLEGTGTLVFTHCGMNAVKSDVTIPATISVVFKNNTGAIDGSVDCWLNDFGATHIVTINGDVTVEDYLVTRGEVIFNGGVTITNGARIYIDEGSATFNGNLTIDGSGSLDKKAGTMVAKGDNAQLTLTGTGTPSINAYLAQQFGLDTSVNEWIGANEGSWNKAYNWKFGIPQADQAVQFDNDAEVMMTTDTYPEVGELVLNTESVKFIKGTGSADKMHVGSVSGKGTLTLDHWGFGQINGRTLEIPDTVELRMKNGSWFGDNEFGGIVNIRGNVVVSDTLELWKSVAIYGNISGTGTIVLKNAGGTYEFNGDNRDFHGTIEKNFNSGLTIGSANAAGTNIAWRVGGDLHINVASGVVKFGSLNLWNTGWCVTYFPKGATTTVEVGAKGLDMEFGDNYFLWAEGTTTDIDITIRKVGKGTLTSRLYNYKKMEVAEGRVILNNPSSFNGTSFKNLTKVTVGKGATLECNIATDTNGMTIDALEFQNGSFYQLALDNGNVVTVNPTQLSFGDNVYMLLSSVDASQAANSQIFASAVTGHPMKSVLTGIGGSIAASTTVDYYWTATYGKDGVWLSSAEVAAAKVETGDSSVTVLDADLAAWLAAGDATDKVNAANDNGVTGILAYMLGAKDYTNATKPAMGATVADGVATLTFDDSAFRRVPGLKLAYYLESCNKADFSEAVTTSAASDEPAVQLEFANAKIFNRLRADVRASE